MRKTQELQNPNSCMNRAESEELTFVLLGRDIAAPYAIRTWVNARIVLGKNQATDQQIVDALNIAQQMEQERKK